MFFNSKPDKPGGFQMKRALVLTYNHFPDGDAGAVRQESFAKILMDEGFDVLVVGMGQCTFGKINTYHNINYLSFRSPIQSFIGKFRNFFGYVYKLKELFAHEKDFDLLLVVDLPISAMKVCEHYAIRKNALLIHDSVEWYSPQQFKYRWLSPEYFRKDLKNRFFFKHPWRVVAISSYLEKHFKSKGLQTIRIPVILDVKNHKWEKKSEPNKTVIVYAGAPGRKDSFDHIIGALTLLEPGEMEKIEFRIIGVSEEKLKSSLGINEKKWSSIHPLVKCLGRVTRQDVIENLVYADFTILMRQSNMRYASAGFPTKVPESLMTGTPIICNLSSDLGMYLHDGVNSLIANDNSTNEILKALRRALYMTTEEKKEMFLRARETAEKYFDYRIYRNHLSEWI